MSDSTEIVFPAGIRAGYKVGPGVLCAEFRFMASTLDRDSSSDGIRYSGVYYYSGAAIRLNFTLGYIWFCSKKKMNLRAVNPQAELAAETLLPPTLPPKQYL
jgi:hypothetical protein